jgi:thiamine transporter ThiT
LRKNYVYQLSLSALFLALALVLPFLTGQLPQLGSALLPMHLPVLLCGFLCGWPWGLAVGFISPLLRTLLFGMPPVMPTAVAMAFELAAYGAFSGLLYSRLTAKEPAKTYIALVIAMLAGRAVWGMVSFVLYSLFLSKAFTAAMFVASAFVTAWPGILVQLVLVPTIILALKKAKLLPPTDKKASSKAA